MEIRLTRGKVAIIDEADWALIEPHRWIAVPSRAGRVWYARTRIGGRIVYMQNLILPLPDGFEPDHRSRDGLDNRRANLRAATRSQNMANTRRSNHSRSGFRGVYEHHGKWSAQIRVMGQLLRLGRFDDPSSAAAAYDAAARQHFGEFAVTNFEARSAA